MLKKLCLIFLLILCIPIVAQEGEDEPLWAEQYYAPYVYMARYPTIQLTAFAEETGVRYFSLAFILANYNCEATWNGTTPIENSYISNFLLPDLESLRALGGDVIISFGGAGGVDLAERCETVESLVEQYQRVIDIYDVTHLDFDIEGNDIRNEETLNRRMEAIAQLQANNLEMGRELFISFTLPVIPTGLTGEGVAVVELARDYEVEIGLVNIMTMNFGASFPSDEMGANTIQAAESLVGQLQSIYPEAEEDALWGQIGLTPMIGFNDTRPENFQIEDAQMVTDFAQEQGIRLIAIWSLDRDAPCAYVNTLANDCSGVEQDELGFSMIFNEITR